MPACHKCGATISEQAKFCSECGTRQRRASAAIDPLIGQQLGAYRVEQCISEGGMGRVYRAEQLSLGRKVCIKTLLPSLLKDKTMVQRFEQEARATSALRHPNIVDVVDFGSSGSQLYFVMELVDGEDLSQLLKRSGALPWARAVELMRQVLSALSEAHAAGVIHRDLKPANVMVSQLRDGTDLAKVTDFGIAKLIDHKGTRITATGAMFGTPHYMAPEQIEGKTLDIRVDIYAAGVMLFELVTGEELFQGEGPLDVFRGHLHKAPRSPSQVASQPLPPQLDTIVHKAVEKARENRFVDALAFQRALTALRDSRTTTPLGSGDAGEDKATMVMQRRAEPEDQATHALRSVIPGPLASHVSDLQALMAGDKRNVTVLFADIENFTGMAEGMSAEALRALVNRCFDGMVEAVARYDGTVDKFMGDCMMAVFGAPKAHENDPERAVRCAIDALGYLASVNRTLAQPVGMRIGIHAGEVVAGGVGGARRMDYTVMGDVVNLAQRLQSNARVGGILVSKAVKKATEGVVVYRALPPLQVKGKTQPISPFEVVRLAEEEAGASATPLVGRARELGKLKQVLAHAARGRVAGAMLVGNAGIGKSRLLEETARWARKAKLIVAQARGGRLGRRSTFDVIRQLMVSIAGGDHSLESLSAMGVAPRTILRLRHMVNGTSMPGGFAPEDNQRMNHAAVDEVLRAAWDTSGLCLLIDDAHQLDPSSLKVLEQLLMGGQRRFALVMAARSGDTGALLPKLPRLALEGLSPADVVRVARNELELESLPEDVADLLAERSDGNPLVAIEVVRSLIDRGDLALVRGKWQVMRQFDPHAVPARLAGIVTARTDALSDASRRFLRMAALAGRRFNLDHMARALGSHSDVTAAVDECVARGFIAHTDDASFLTFPQSMVHDALLNAVTDVDKRQLHLALAQALESHAGSMGEGSYDRLAHHYLHAGKIRHANRYLVASAGALLHTQAFEEAAIKLDQALKLIVDELKRHGQPNLKLAAYIYDIASKLIAARATTSVDKAVSVIDQVLPHLPQHLAPAERSDMLREHAAALNKQGHAREAQRYLEQAHQLLFKMNEPERMAKVYSELSTALETQGSLGKATDVLVEGFRMVAGSAPKDPDLLWQYLNQLGRLHLRSGQADRAEQFFDNALEHAVRAENVAAQARIVSNQGSLRAQGGDYTSAQQLLLRSLQLAAESGDQVAEARGHYNLGRLQVALGRIPSGAEHLRKSAQLSQRLGYREGFAAALNALDALKKQQAGKASE